LKYVIEKEVGATMNGRIKTQLANLLAQRFSMSELESLVFSLDAVDFENLEGRIKKAKAESLVAYMERRGRVEELLKQIETDRPELSDQINEIRKSLQNNRGGKPQSSYSKIPVWIIAGGSIALLLLLLVLGWRWLGNVNGEPTAVPGEFTYQVKVQDVVSGMPIQQATVTLATSSGSVPDTQITDVNGIAVFQLPNSQVDSEAILSVQKSGYRNFTQYISLKPDRLPQNVLIEPNS